MLRAVALLALLLALVAAGGAAQRVNDSLVVHYTFQEGQNNPELEYSTDVSGNDPSFLGDVAFNKGKVGWKAESVGLNYLAGASKVGAVTTQGFGEVRSHIQDAAALTVELWLSVDNEPSSTVVVGGVQSYAVVDPEAGTTLEPYSSCDIRPARLGGLQISVDSAGVIALEVRSGLAECVEVFYEVPKEDLGKPQHVVLTIGEAFERYVQSPYLNGLLFTGVAFDTFEPSFWMDLPMAFGPVLSDGNGGSLSFEGTLYMFSIYNRTLTPTEVRANYEAGLPNSRPVVATTELRMDEDTPTLFNLSGSDFDGDNATIEVTTFPRPGTGNLSAVLANGTVVPITNDTVPVQLDAAGGNTIRYEPPFHGTGVQAVVKYRAFDGRLYSVEQPIIFNVTSINDLPVPTPLAADAFAAEPTVLQLNGTDADIGSSLTGARVGRLPANGTLYQFNASAAAGGFRGAPMAEGEASSLVVVDPELRVVYVSSDGDAGLSGATVVGPDSFTFFLTDNAGAESAGAGTVSLTVLNSLAALATAVNTDEDVETAFDFGYRTRFVGEEVGVVLTSLPSAGGTLRLDADDAAPVTEVPFELPAGSARMRYAPARDQYGAPLDTWSFRVRRRRDGWESGPGLAAATVAPVNDPPVLEVRMLSGGGDGLATVSNAARSASFSVTVRDPDADTSPYRVRLSPSAAGAFVTVSEAAVGTERLSFRSNDGFTDTGMVFDALRADVNAALSNVTLTAADAGFGDVEVTVEDGELTVTRRVSYTTVSATSSSATSTSSVPPEFAIWVMTMLLLVPFGCCAAYWTVRGRRFFFQRKAEKAPTLSERRAAEARARRRTFVDYLLPLQGQLRENVSSKDVELAGQARP